MKGWFTVSLPGWAGALTFMPSSTEPGRTGQPRTQTNVVASGGQVPTAPSSVPVVPVWQGHSADAIGHVARHAAAHRQGCLQLLQREEDHGHGLILHCGQSDEHLPEGEPTA